MKRALIFGGPSLFGVERTHETGLVFAPPAKAGDILRAASAGYRRIGVIDGEFEHTPAVWHKEILWALSRGISIWGAASLGALRAAECQQFGMRGVGEIFNDYAEGRRVSDGDVAVIHAPPELEFAPLTVSLVDCEWAIDQVLRENTEFRANLLRAVRSCHFKERTWETALHASGASDSLKKSFLAGIFDLGHLRKARDAMLLLEAIQSEEGENPAKFEFSNTIFISQLVQDLT